MTKKFTTVAAILLGLSLAACKPTKPTTEKPSENKTPAENQTQNAPSDSSSPAAENSAVQTVSLNVTGMT